MCVCVCIFMSVLVHSIYIKDDNGPFETGSPIEIGSPIQVGSPSPIGSPHHASESNLHECEIEHVSRYRQQS